MSDRRFFAANDRVISRYLADQDTSAIEERQIVDPVLKTVSQPVVNLLDAPGGGLNRQLLFGQAIELLEVHNGYAFVCDPRDGYVGYIGAKQFRDPVQPSHRVNANAAQLYPRSTIKSVPFMTLPLGAEVAVQSTRSGFAKLATGGFIPEQLITGKPNLEKDPVAEAERYLGAPYLWGGNSIWGLDCSGLVRAGFCPSGIRVAADSDLQETSFGSELAVDAPLQRCDLVFWKGHVGIMQAPDQILHANAHHMKVTSEPLSEVADRIAKSGGGEITSRRRLD
jgi:cell wall-associated NlpC family hydrolase